MKSVLCAAVAALALCGPVYADPFDEVARMPPARADVHRKVQDAPPQADTYRSSAGYARMRAYCELYADSTSRSTFAFGSIGFVVGATIGAAIGGAIEHAGTYQRCMTVYGYPG